MAGVLLFPAGCKVREEHVGIQLRVVKCMDAIHSSQLIVMVVGVQPFDIGSNPGVVVLPNGVFEVSQPDLV